VTLAFLTASRRYDSRGSWKSHGVKASAIPGASARWTSCDGGWHTDLTDGSARPAKAGLTTEQSVGRLGALAMAAARAPCSFGRTGTQLLGRECQRLDGAPGPGEDDSTFGGVHQQRRAAGSFVRLQADLPERPASASLVASNTSFARSRVLGSCVPVTAPVTAQPARKPVPSTTRCQIPM